MANYILNQLLNFNKEFEQKYKNYFFQGKIFTFDIFQSIFLKNTCSSDYKISLKDLFKYDINLMSPYLATMHILKAINGEKILDEIITEKPKIVYGKQYLTRNFPTIYDCTSLWIETKKYVIDPVLCIVMDKSIKDNMHYKNIFVDNNYRCDYSFFVDTLSDMSCFKKFCDYNYYKYRKLYIVPRDLNELNINLNEYKKDYALARKYLKETNSKLYQKMMTLIRYGDIKDLTLNIKNYDKIMVCEKYNPDLTLGQMLREGLNYGRCGLFAKIFSTMIYANTEQYYINGECRTLKGSKNSKDGNHAWLLIDDKIIDTSFMIEMPKEYGTLFGYNGFDKEKCTGKKQEKVFGKGVDIESNIHFFDVMRTYAENELSLFKCDFARFLPSIVNNDENCKFHYNDKETKCCDIYENVFSMYNNIAEGM